MFRQITFVTFDDRNVASIIITAGTLQTGINISYALNIH